MFYISHTLFALTCGLCLFSVMYLLNPLRPEGTHPLQLLYGFLFSLHILQKREHMHINSRSLQRQISDNHVSLWELAAGCPTKAAVVLSTTIAVNIVFPIGSASDAIGRTGAMSMAPIQRLSIPCHLVPLPALPSWDHFFPSQETEYIL